MSGRRAKALRREAPASPFGKYRPRRPTVETHPIQAARLGRKARRSAIGDLRAKVRAAARARNLAASERGVGTPAVSIHEAIRRIGPSILAEAPHFDKGDRHRLLSPPEDRQER